MPANHTPFPLSGDNFRAVAHVETDLELSVMILELGFPMREADSCCTDDDLAADYAVAVAAFEQREKRTDTVYSSLSADPDKIGRGQ